MRLLLDQPEPALFSKTLCLQEYADGRDNYAPDGLEEEFAAVQAFEVNITE